MPAWGELALIAGLLGMAIGFAIAWGRGLAVQAKLQAQLDAKVGSIEAATGALDIGAKTVDADALIQAKVAAADAAQKTGEAVKALLLLLLFLPGCALFRSPPGPTPPILCEDPSVEAWRDFKAMAAGGAGRSWVVNVYEHPCKQNAEIRKQLGYPVPEGMVK